MGEIKKLGGPAEVLIMLTRDGHFYPIQGVVGVPLAQQAADHGRINSHVREVQDLQGATLWRRLNA